MNYTKVPLTIEALVTHSGPIWIERMDCPYTDIQGWARIFPRFNSEHSVGFRYLNGIAAYKKNDYGTGWMAYTVVFDPTKGTPVLCFGTVVSLEELSTSSDVNIGEIRTLRELIFSK